jgi:hypothetical protein
MKRFVGWAVSAGLVLAASVAHAQMPAPYRAISDFQGPDFQGPYERGPYERPYGAVPPAPPPVYNYGQYGGGPSLLPPQEIYAILRDNGFSPLGVPTQRGLVYTVAVIDRNGDDGRLVIDARNGRIIRFQPAEGYGYGYGHGPYGQRPYDQGFHDQGVYDQGFHDQGFYGSGFPSERMSGYGPDAALPPPIVIRATPPRPPAPIPQAASRAVPLPAPKPATAGTSPDPTPQPSASAATRSAAPPATTAHASVAPQGSATVGEAKPVPTIRPTQEMPKVQDLE